MRRIVLLLSAVSVLAGCGGSGSRYADPSPARGRFVGIGTYTPGLLWPRMAMAGPAKSAAAATAADDEHVIVVVDSQTGEVRECGDYSGLCVSLNPWTKAVAREQASPVTLTKHLADVIQDQNAQAARKP